MKTKKKAFTLTELLVIVIVIGVLSAVVLPKFSKVLETRKTTEAEDVMAAVRTEQERRCALDQKYFSNISNLSDIVPNTSTKNFNYSLQNDGAGMLAMSKGNYSYGLRMLSFADGRVCCEGDDCSKLNKDYESCSELPNKSDFNDGSECLMTAEPTPVPDDPINPVIPIDPYPVKPIVYIPIVIAGKISLETASCGCGGMHQRYCNTLSNTCEDWSECQAGGVVIPDTPCSDEPEEEEGQCVDRTDSLTAYYQSENWPAELIPMLVGNGGGSSSIRVDSQNCCRVANVCQDGEWVAPANGACIDTPQYCGVCQGSACGGTSGGGSSGSGSGSSGSGTGSAGCNISARPPDRTCCCTRHGGVVQNNLQKEKAFSFYYAASIGGGGAAADVIPVIVDDGGDTPGGGSSPHAHDCGTGGMAQDQQTVGTLTYFCDGGTWRAIGGSSCASFPCN